MSDVGPQNPPQLDQSSGSGPIMVSRYTFLAGPQNPPQQDQSSGSGPTVASRHPFLPDPSKRVCFYKSGDPQFSGLRMVVNSRTFKTFDSLLDSLSKKVPLPFGVRNITTPHGVHAVRTLEELEDGKSYICSDQRRVKPIDLEAASRKPPPWSGARPVSARRRAIQLARQSVARPRRREDAVVVRTPRRLTVFRNGDPSRRHTVMLQRRTTQTFESLLNYLSQVMQFLVVKLHTPDGRRVDSLPALILCSGVVVAAGREPFRSGNYDYQQPTLPSRLAAISNRMPPRKLPLVTRKKKSSSSSSKSRTFSPSSERYFMNQINNSIAESLCDLPSYPMGSVEEETDDLLGSLEAEDNPGVASDDDIEKSFRVNQDGSMTVEMRVRLTIKEEEVIHWTTTLSRTSVANQLKEGWVLQQESDLDSPDTNNVVSGCANNDPEAKGYDSKEENCPSPMENRNSREEGVDEMCTGEAVVDRSSFGRVPTPGPRSIKIKQSSVESVHSASDSELKQASSNSVHSASDLEIKQASAKSVHSASEPEIQENMVGTYSYIEESANGDITEEYCMIRQCNSRPIPKPRKIVSCDMSNGLKSLGVAEVLQIQNNGEEITETVLHIYEQQSCHDNFFANTQVRVGSRSVYGSMYGRPASSETAARSSSNDYEVELQRPFTASQSLGWRNTDGYSLPKHKMSSNDREFRQVLPEKAKGGLKGQSVGQVKTKAMRPKVKKNNTASLSVNSDKKRKESNTDMLKESKKVRTDILSPYGQRLSKRKTKKGNGKVMADNKSSSKNTHTSNINNSNLSENTCKLNIDILNLSENTSVLNIDSSKRLSSDKELNLIHEKSFQDHAYNADTKETPNSIRKNLLDVLPTMAPMDVRKVFMRQTSMHEDRRNVKETRELTESISWPALHSSHAVANEYVEHWLDNINLELTHADANMEPTVNFQIGSGDESSSEESELEHERSMPITEEQQSHVTTMEKQGDTSEKNSHKEKSRRSVPIAEKQDNKSVVKTDILRHRGQRLSKRKLKKGNLHGKVMADLKSSSKNPRASKMNNSKLSENSHASKMNNSKSSENIRASQMNTSNLSENTRASKMNNSKSSENIRASQMNTSNLSENPRASKMNNSKSSENIRASEMNNSNLSEKRHGSKIDNSKLSENTCTLNIDNSNLSGNTCKINIENSNLSENTCALSTDSPKSLCSDKELNLTQEISVQDHAYNADTNATPISIKKNLLDVLPTMAPMDIRKVFLRQTSMHEDRRNVKETRELTESISWPALHSSHPVANEFVEHWLDNIHLELTHADTNMEPTVNFQIGSGEESSTEEPELKSEISMPITEELSHVPRVENQGDTSGDDSLKGKSLSCVPRVKNQGDSSGDDSLKGKSLSCVPRVENQSDTSGDDSLKGKSLSCVPRVKNQGDTSGDDSLKGKSLSCVPRVENQSDSSGDNSLKGKSLSCVPRVKNQGDTSGDDSLKGKSLSCVPRVKNQGDTSGDDSLKGKSLSCVPRVKNQGDTTGDDSLKGKSLSCVPRVEDQSDSSGDDSLKGKTLSCVPRVEDQSDSLGDDSLKGKSLSCVPRVKNQGDTTGDDSLKGKSLSCVPRVKNQGDTTGDDSLKGKSLSCVPRVKNQGDTTGDDSLKGKSLSCVPRVEEQSDSSGDDSLKGKSLSCVPRVENQSDSSGDDSLKGKSLCCTSQSASTKPTTGAAIVRSRKTPSRFPTETEKRFTSRIEQSDMEHVLQQLCSSIQTVRQVSQHKRPSCLEKSQSLPDFTSHLVSTFGSSSKALLAFLSVMTSKESVNFPGHHMLAKSECFTEALKMMESLKRIASLEDADEVKVSLTDLQKSTSSKLMQSWRDFQEFNDRAKNPSLSPDESEDEYLFEACPEDCSKSGEQIEEQPFYVQELTEELGISEKLKDRLSAKANQEEKRADFPESIVEPEEIHFSGPTDDIAESITEEGISATRNIIYNKCEVEGDSNVKEVPSCVEKGANYIDEHITYVKQQDNWRKVDASNVQEQYSYLKGMASKVKEQTSHSEEEDNYNRNPDKDQDNCEEEETNLDGEQIMKVQKQGKCCNGKQFSYEDEQASSEEELDSNEEEQDCCLARETSCDKRWVGFEENQVSYAEEQMSTTKDVEGYARKNANRVVERVSIQTFAKMDVPRLSEADGLTHASQLSKPAMREELMREPSTMFMAHEAKGSQLHTDCKEFKELTFNSVSQSVKTLQELMDSVNSAPLPSSLAFSYDSKNSLKKESEGARVKSIKEMFLAKSNVDVQYGHKRLSSPNTSDLSDYRPETSDSGGNRSQTSELSTESGEDDSGRSSIARGYVRRTIERLYGKNDGNTKDIVSKRPRSATKTQRKDSPGKNRVGSVNPFQEAKSKVMADLSYFNATGTLDVCAEATQCFVLNAQMDICDGVVMDKGPWFFKENHPTGKSPPDIVFCSNRSTKKPSADSGQEKEIDNVPYSYFGIHQSPLAVISSAELEELSKPAMPKFTYFNLPHGSDSDPFQDDLRVKSKNEEKVDDSAEKKKEKDPKSPPATEAPKKWAERNGSPSLVPAEFKKPDNKVHPLVVPSVARPVVTQPPRTQGRTSGPMHAQDSLEMLHVMCGQYCPIL